MGRRLRGAGIQYRPRRGRTIEEGNRPPAGDRARGGGEAAPGVYWWPESSTIWRPPAPVATKTIGPQKR